MNHLVCSALNRGVIIHYYFICSNWPLEPPGTVQLSIIQSIIEFVALDIDIYSNTLKLHTLAVLGISYEIKKHQIGNIEDILNVVNLIYTMGTQDKS